MNEFQSLAVAIVCGWIVMSLLWVREYGWRRSLIISVIRLAWCLPIILVVVPHFQRDILSKVMSVRTIHLLEDDSESMTPRATQTFMSQFRKNLQDKCLLMGCRIETTKLSDLSDKVEDGYTPLQEVVKAWLPLTHNDPWVVVSDGGDSNPSQAWSSELAGLGRTGSLTLGTVVLAPFDEQDNIWLTSENGADFGFDQKGLDIELTVHRRMKDMNSELTIQLQASSLGKTLSTQNISFRPQEASLNVVMSLPSLQRGSHLVKFSALPIAQETATWDNSFYKSIEILPNTIGILHLLGSPSWDGRFVRRYLKSEPKYDLISFFILRDPSDVQIANERDLSLIPFPVERLFTEELPNFRSVIIQNFSLSQFLEPNYQKNLVDFVLNGGGLLFIGGPRALKDMDLSSSPLASLLPFKIKQNAGLRRERFFWDEQSSIPYEPNQKFKIKFADPSANKRLLANLYDEWKQLPLNLQEGETFSGLHRIDKMELSSEGVTPLLVAELEDGSETLLAAASYPGKGRAIWIFSDSLWKLAINPGADSSREAYHGLLKSAMTWLLREEMQRPLWLQEISLTEDGPETQWSVHARGPAAKYFVEAQPWTYRICGQVVESAQVDRQMVSDEDWILSGRIPVRFMSGASCEILVEGQHPAFGSVKSSAYSVFPETFRDREIEGSSHKLEALSTLTGSNFLAANDREFERKLDSWMGSLTGSTLTQEKSEAKLVPDYYWPIKTWWGLLLLLALPFEVLVRRWFAIFGAGRRSNSI